MTLTDLMQMLGGERIELWVVLSKDEWGASIIGGEIKEGAMLGGGNGWGPSPLAALQDLCRKLAGKRLVLDAFKDSRKEFNIPSSLRLE